MLGKPVHHDIATIAKTLGSWRYEFPKNGHSTVYRPPFPGMLHPQEKDGVE